MYLTPSGPTVLIASLMMYLRPETEGATQRFWSLIRDALAHEGIPSPVGLSQQADALAVWKDPDLVLSQCCGMPYRTRLHRHVNLVGTPDYGLEDCPPGYYRSAIVVRCDDQRNQLCDFQCATLAYNQPGSQSGFAAIWAQAAAHDFWFTNTLQTHAHLASAQAVADGRADITALDALTWRMIEQYDQLATRLRVLTWTTPTPGLPLITSQQHNPYSVFRAVRQAIMALSDDDLLILGLTDLIKIPSEDYLNVQNPPSSLV